MSNTKNNLRNQPNPKKTDAFNAAAQDKGAPAVILVRPYLDANIGTVARAMLNSGLTELRVVNPFCEVVTEMSRARASGADDILEQAKLFSTVGEAVADLGEVVGTSARQRDMTVKIVSPEEAAKRAVEAFQAFDAGTGPRSGYMFGSERNGLTNEDLVYATCLLQIPTQPAFSSLNLGQAVQICGYEYWKRRAQLKDLEGTASFYKENYMGLAKGTRLATVGEVEGLWSRCQEMLDLTELNPDPIARRLLYDRLKSWLLRSSPDVKDVNAMHGAISAVCVKHEKLEGVKQRLIEANKGHGRKRVNGKSVKVAVEEKAWREEVDHEVGGDGAGGREEVGEREVEEEGDWKEEEKRRGAGW